MDIIVTNNPLAEAGFRDRFRIEFFDASADVLTYARDLVHAGHVLLTHPLPGSVKPGETPYKTILISGSGGEVDAPSLRMIEECIRLTRDFPPCGAPGRYEGDLQMVDLSLIRSALEGR